MFVNPDLAYDAGNRIQDNGPKYSATKPDAQQRQRMLQAVQLQMAFAGAPMIYYGDETGMWGPDDPSNRQPMVWRDLEPYDDPQVKFDPQIFQTYQRAIATRAKLPALQTGFFHTILADDQTGTYAFARDLGEQHVYFALNRSAHDQRVSIPVDSKAKQLVNWLDERQADLVPANSQNPAARTAIELKPDSKPIAVQRQKCTLTLPAWGSAILSERP
jgi:glycosidase